MKYILTVSFISLLIYTGCSRRQTGVTIKDLDENMMDLRIYQENLGDMIEEGRLQDAVWLLDGADSILQVMSNTFKEHRKLSRPFSWFYDKKLKLPLREIEKAIRENNRDAAAYSYRVLVRKCNSCHIDHDINKEVRY